MIDRTIAVLQIIGASAATAAVLGALITPGVAVASFVIYLIMFAFCLFTLFAGLWLWNGELRGYRLIAFSLAFQIPVLQSSIMSYKFSFGLGISLFLAGEPGKFRWDMGGFGHMAFFSGDIPALAGINLMAIAALVWILWRQHRLEAQQIAAEVADAGQQGVVEKKAGPAQSGALIYASDVTTLATFYEHCFGLAVVHKTEDRVILGSEELQLVIHQRPEGQPSVPAEEPASSIKLFFSVDSIDGIQSTIGHHGGRVLPQRWPGPLFDTINVLDPEGNRQHVREFHAPASDDVQPSTGH